MLQLALELQFYVTVIFLKDKIQNYLNLMIKAVTLQMRTLGERQNVINTKEINIYNENIIYFGKNSVLKYKLCQNNWKQRYQMTIIY